MKYTTTNSKKLFTDAKKSMVSGVASSLHQYAWQDYPIYIESGKGSKIYDADGNEYIDYLLGFGPVILGYSNDSLTNAVIEQLGKSSQTASPSQSLIDLSDKICTIIPSAEKISTFLNSGTEADLHGIRLARAYTGKTKIVKFEGGYHGWSDELKVSVEAQDVSSLGPRNKPFVLKHFPGQKDPDATIVAPFNDLNLLEELFKKQGNDIAAVILEPVLFNTHPVFPLSDFLEGLRDLTIKYDILLIFDEVITGFRFSLGGAQEYFKVTPDISTFAKAMGGGFPISTVVGREDIVKSLTATAGTFNGNPISVAASLATIKELEKEGRYSLLQKKSEKLVSGTVALGEKYGIKMWGKAVGATWSINFGVDRPLVDFRDGITNIDIDTYRKFAEGCLERGVRINPWRGRMYMSTEHSEEDISKTIDTFDDVLSAICDIK